MSSKQLELAYAHCERVIKEHSKSFYAAFSTLPQNRSRAVFAVYAFCRYADDLVDCCDDPKQAQEGLDELERTLQSLYDTTSGPVTEEVRKPAFLWQALEDSIRNWEIPIDPFLDQIRGQRQDLLFRQPASEGELYEYCDDVAGSVGRMLLPILSSDRSEKMVEVVSDLGIAMQITNILRDIGEDYKDRQRIYLPATLMQKYDVTQDMIASGKVTENFVQMWKELAEDAEVRYQAFLGNLACFHAKVRGPLCASALIYRGILGAVEDAEYDCLTKRNYTTSLQRVALLEEAQRRCHRI